MFPSTLSFIHRILKELPLVLNLVENELRNVREGGEEGSVVVFWQPTSSSLKQREQVTVSEWVRRVSPIGVGVNPDVTSGALQALKEIFKLLIVPKLVLTNKQRKFPRKNSPSARITIFGCFAMARGLALTGLIVS